MQSLEGQSPQPRSRHLSIYERSTRKPTQMKFFHCCSGLGVCQSHEPGGMRHVIARERIKVLAHLVSKANEIPQRDLNYFSPYVEFLATSMVSSIRSLSEGTVLLTSCESSCAAASRLGAISSIRSLGKRYAGPAMEMEATG